MSCLPSPLHHSDLREYLLAILRHKQAKNPRFTQSDVGRTLNLSPSAWTNFVEGRRALSEEKLLEIGSRLGWTPDEISHALALRALEKGNSNALHSLRRRTQARSASYSRPRVVADETEVRLDFLTIVLLESVRLPEYQYSPVSVAERIGYSEGDAQRALDQLLKSGALVRDEDGSFRRPQHSVVFSGANRNSKIRTFYRQMLDVTSRTIRAENADRRCIGNETLAFDPSRLPEAQEIVSRCLHDLAALAIQCEKPSTIYHLGVQFVELLEPKKEDAE